MYGIKKFRSSQNVTDVSFFVVATSVQPLWRSHVDLSVIGLAGEDAPADFAVGGGEEDLRRLEMEPEVLLRCDGGFRRWSSSGELYDAEAEAGQERQRTTLT